MSKKAKEPKPPKGGKKAGKKAAKKGGGPQSPPKAARRRRGVQTRAVGLLGLALLGFLAVLLLQQRLTLGQAAQRAVVVLVVLLAVERVLLPVFHALASTPDRGAPGPPDDGRPPTNAASSAPASPAVPDPAAVSS